MAETLGTIASVLQLIDVALKAREYIQDFRHALDEKKKLLLEMEELRRLLEQLRKRIDASSSDNLLQNIKSPLSAFEKATKYLSEQLRPGEGTVSKFSIRLKWSMWNKKETVECLSKFEQFKSLVNGWLLMDLGFVSPLRLVRYCELISNF